MSQWEAAMTSAGRSRRCALCQQFYGSGLLDNVAAPVRRLASCHRSLSMSRLTACLSASNQELLRARRLLRERNAHDDSSTGRLLREGLDQFLSDLTRQRDALESSQRHVPLDVCVFCVQFLPSSYHDSSALDEEHFAGFAAAGRPSTSSSSRRRGHPTRSSLVIQHQFPSKATALGSMVKTVKTPRSTEPPTYRLLSSNATRVLRIESPAAALTTATSYPQNTDLQHPHGLLAATNVMHDLRAQEAQQGAAILRAERGKRELHDRRRASAALATREAAERNSERVYGGSETQHQNIVQLLKNGGAASLYSGVALPEQSSKPTTRMSLVAGAARVVTRKHDRHFRSELLFPPVAHGTHASQSKRLT